MVEVTMLLTSNLILNLILNLKFILTIIYMKILSFDVGIKNLSFCLLEEDIIKGWGILNICTDDICDHCSKDGKRCDFRKHSI